MNYFRLSLPLRTRSGKRANVIVSEGMEHCSLVVTGTLA